ncbi:MAG: prepilin-type N-terminal cleavage/methylation domain-containing protein [Candidatus Acidiferrales bacterium]
MRHWNRRAIWNQKTHGRSGLRGASAAGFSLIEAMVAMVVLAFGILGLAAMMTDGIAYMNMSQADFIAQQKAEAAIESIFYARDSKIYTWAQLQNVSTPGGVFLNGPEVLCDPGPDGVIDTADDILANVDVIYAPNTAGSDTLTGPDAIKMPLSAYKRTVVIANVAGDPNVRTITVTINYIAGRFQRTYTLTSYISRFS